MVDVLPQGAHLAIFQRVDMCVRSGKHACLPRLRQPRTARHTGRSRCAAGRGRSGRREQPRADPRQLSPHQGTARSREGQAVTTSILGSGSARLSRDFKPDRARRNRANPPITGEFRNQKEAPTRWSRLARRLWGRRVEARPSVSDLNPDHIVEHQRVQRNAVRVGTGTGRGVRIGPMFDCVRNDLAGEQHKVVPAAGIAHLRQGMDRSAGDRRRFWRSRKRQAELGVKFQRVPLYTGTTRGC